MEELQYPIGKFVRPAQIDGAQMGEWILALETLPERLQQLVMPLDDIQLGTPYRPGGWTVRQLVHHIADSHHNSYIRFKWALTEERPVIKAYDEKAWANLFDSRTAPIQPSLDHLRAVHQKLVYLLKGLTSSDFNRTFIHPDSQMETSLKENVGRYAWHGNHHLAHIKGLLEREGWL
jgi:hypothetical protein